MGQMLRRCSCRNVNEALRNLVYGLSAVPPDTETWERFTSRGLETIEMKGPYVTTYERPRERVLFCPVRDANPFFHFFEALWILNGSDDVEFLSRFSGQIAQFSDNGKTFHAPYGYRLRYAFGIDQIAAIITMLRAKPDTRQAVMSIWDPAVDLRAATKDYPCNDTVFFKIRNGSLRMSVFCRSNDALLGAYGANAVQFSMIQEFIASAVGVEVGPYMQFSDSFHVYTESGVLKRLQENAPKPMAHYETQKVKPYSLFEGLASGEWEYWLRSLRRFMVNGPVYDKQVPMFFKQVVHPLYLAWNIWKDESLKKDHRIEGAQKLVSTCAASDWGLACLEWLERRREAP